MTDAASPSPEDLAPVLASLKEVLATIFIGFTIATTFYGITCLQVYLYYKSYPHDSRFLKFMVTAFWIMDTLGTALVAHSIYVYMVLNLDNPLADLKIPWSFAVENQLVDFVTLVAQLYFAYQLWRLPTSRILCLVIFGLAFAAFACSLPLTVRLFQDELGVQALASRRIYVLGSTEQGLAAVCDIVITGGLIYYLKGWRGGFQSTRAVLDSIILYVITRGTLTAICQIMFSILIASMPTRTIWQPFHQAVGKLYVNSVLASLNFRMVEGTGSGAFPLGRIAGQTRTGGTLTEVSFHDGTNPTMMFSSTTSRPKVTEVHMTVERDVEVASDTSGGYGK